MTAHGLRGILDNARQKEAGVCAKARLSEVWRGKCESGYKRHEVISVVSSAGGLAEVRESSEDFSPRKKTLAT